jgi:hypothetical protein
MKVLSLRPLHTRKNSDVNIGLNPERRPSGGGLLSPFVLPLFLFLMVWDLAAHLHPAQNR